MRTGKHAIDSSEHGTQDCKSSFSRPAKSIVTSPAWKRKTSSSPGRDFECLDCRLIAPLNAHGRCRRCDSNGVIQTHAFGTMANRAA